MTGNPGQKKSDFSQNQRSNPNRVGQVNREVKRQINTDWQYLQAQNIGNNASSDQIFNQNYQNQGLQPQDLNQKGNEEKQPKTDTNESSYQSRYSSRKGRRQLKSSDKNKPGQKIASRSRNKTPLSRKKNKLSKIAKTAAARSKSSVTTTTILIWYLPLWLKIQLLLGGGFCLVGLLATAAREESNLVALSLWLSDFGEIAEYLFVLGYLVILAVGFISLLIIYFEYTFTLTKPLTGNKGGLKVAMLLLSILGYATPLVNFLPWHLVWVLVVWLYPE